jgi:CelD/BcsL family acetyltransferase involved in cellulose biosynthesis
LSVDRPSVSLDDAGRPTWDVLDDPHALAPAWRALETDGVTTPFQNFAWVSTWTAARAGTGEVALVVARRGDRLDAVLPFEIRRIGPLRIAHWLSGRHAGYNFGLWRRDAVPAPADIVAGLERIGRARGIDLFVLENMPLVWDGMANPLAGALRTHSALDDGHHLHLAPTFDALLAGRNAGHKRKKIRAKEKMLAAAGDYRIVTASSDDEAKTALAAFFAQKADSLSRLGIADPFAPGTVRAFYTALATGERPVLEVTRLEAGGAIRAVLGSIVGGTTSHQLFVSTARDEMARASPGETLFHRHIEAACARGLALYDMGMGAERYKASWCDRTTPLVTALHAVTPLGRAYGWAFALQGRLKARIRRDEKLWARVRGLRARVIGRRVGGDEAG